MKINTYTWKLNLIYVIGFDFGRFSENLAKFCIAFMAHLIRVAQQPKMGLGKCIRYKAAASLLAGLKCLT